MRTSRSSQVASSSPSYSLLTTHYSLGSSRAQAIIEYAVLFGLVTAVLMGMQGYLKRGVQAGVKVAADQIGNQSNGLVDSDLKLDWKRKGDTEVFTRSASSKVTESRAQGERVHRVDERTTSSGILSQSGISTQ